MKLNPKVDWFPAIGWMSCLREGDRIWLVKEDVEATISYNYSYGSGQVCLTRSDRSNAEFWHIDYNGDGFDKKPLIRPIKGKCSSEPITISESKLDELERKIDMQKAYLTSLERRVSVLLTASMYDEFQLFLHLKATGALTLLEDDEDE